MCLNTLNPTKYLVVPTMPPNRKQKTSCNIVSEYDLCKVYILYICKDSTSLYLPRSALKKAALLQEYLLTCVAQKQQTGPTTRSSYRVLSLQLLQLSKTNRSKPASISKSVVGNRSGSSSTTGSLCILETPILNTLKCLLHFGLRFRSSFAFLSHFESGVVVRSTKFWRGGS